jgi:cob(I)alamin adenosyltransferase
MSEQEEQSKTEIERNKTHNKKMQKIKAARDKLMATKTEEKGLIMVHTGPGKGKSSSGFGMIMRCIAHGIPCAVVQFIKGT